jgi:hypothetical protein
MNQSLRMQVEPVRTLAAGSIIPTYTSIGTGFTNPARLIHLQNLTDATLWFSYNGVDDHFPLVEQSFLLLDVTSNKADAGGGYFLPAGQRIYVRRLIVPTTGSVYLTVYYGANPS